MKGTSQRAKTSKFSARSRAGLQGCIDDALCADALTEISAAMPDKPGTRLHSACHSASVRATALIQSSSPSQRHMPCGA
jgi:hypothetical protein